MLIFNDRQQVFYSLRAGANGSCPQTVEKGLSQNDLEKSIGAAPLFTAKLKADRLKTQKTAHEN